MSIEANRQRLKEHNIEIIGTLRQKLKAEHYQWMVDHLDDKTAKDLFSIVIQDRNERAKINQAQSQDITRKVSKNVKLNEQCENLTKEKDKLQQEVKYWKQVADDLNQAFEVFQKLTMDTTDALYKQLVHQIGERSEICRAIRRVRKLYNESRYIYK